MSYHRERDPWRDFDRALKSCERDLNNLRYAGALQPPPPDSSIRSFLSVYRDLPQGAIALGQTQSLSKGDAVAPPHGFDLLKPLSIPEFPKFPARPEIATSAQLKAWSLLSRREPEPPEPSIYQKYSIERAERVERKRQQLQAEFDAQFKKDPVQLASLREACAANDPEAVRLLMLVSQSSGTPSRRLCLFPSKRRLTRFRELRCAQLRFQILRRCGS